MRLFLIAIAAVFALGTGMAYAEDGEALFKGKGKCKKCHKTSDKKSVGPGLKDVSKRFSDGWLKSWLHDPQATWEANDAETQAMKKNLGREGKAKTRMKIGKLSDGEIDAIVAYLKTL